MTPQIRSQTASKSSFWSARRGASARKVRAQRRLALEMLETRQLLAASVTNTLTASGNPIVVGDSVTFTALIAPGDGGTPTGQVVFTVDGQSQTPVDLQDVDGQEEATFSTSSLAQGTHHVSAAYNGDDNFDPATSDSLLESVNSTTATVGTTTTLNASASPATVGDSVTFTAVVAPGDAGTPTGQVVFTIDGQDQAPVNLQAVDGQEVATFTTATLTQGTHAVSATYDGDDTYLVSTSSALAEAINGATTTTLTSSSSPATVGDSVTFTAMVATSGTGTPSGHVVFTLDGQDQAPVDLQDVDGQEEATFTTSTLSVGSHTVTATYSGDDNFTGSASDTFSETVNQAATTTTLTSSSNPATVGDSVTFTAVVATSGTGTPSGQVVFTVDGQDQAPVDLADVDGQEEATFTTSTLSVGSHTVTATYSGDDNFTGSASDTFSETVNQVTTTTALTSSSNPATVGASITLTAVVSTADGSTPTGQVVFTIDGEAQAPVDLQVVDGQEVATFTTSTLTQGLHTITAAYGGDDNHETSTSDVLSEVVNSAAATVGTTTVVSISSNPATVGDSVTLTAVVAPGDAGTPTGQVVFTIDGQDQSPVDLQTVDGQEVATLTTATLSQGSHTVSATYEGDDTYLVSTSSTLNEQINGVTTTTVTSSSNPATVDDSVTFTAVVSTSGTGTPSGQVVFTIDGQAQAPVDLADVAGQEEATFTTAALSVGSHTVTATYSGDDNFTGSASDTFSQTVSQAATTTTLTSSSNPSASGDSVTFTAVVSTSGAGTPSGQVVFTIDGQAQAPVDLSNAGGQDEATFTTSTLGLGTHTVTASYGGDTNFSESVSSTFTQVALTNAQAGAPTLAPQSQTGQGSSQGYTKDNGSAAAPLVFDIPNADATLFYRLYDVSNPSSPVLLAGPVQLTGGEITVNGHTLADGTYQVAYTTSASATDPESAPSQAGTLNVQTSLTATVNPAGNYLTVLPNNQVVVTFNRWLAGLAPDQANGSGFTSAPFAVMLIPSGPDGKATQALTGSLWSAPSGVDSGDLPIPATLVYHQNADGTSTITLTANQPLSSDVYLISVSSSLTDLAGNLLSGQHGALGTFYSSFALAATPANSTPLAVTSVTTNNGSVVINNNLIAQPDTIAIGFNKPLDLWTANSSTIQLWQKNADGTYQQVQAVATYSPSTNSVYLTPEALLVPGTVYIVSVSSSVSDDQAFPNTGGTLGQNFYTSFEVNAAGVGAGQSPLTVVGTNPGNGALVTSPLGYGSVTFSEAIDPSSLGRYSAMLVPHTGGVTTGDSGYADVPFNAKLAFNPNTNQLIIVPTGMLTDGTIDLFALSGISATNGDPLTNPGGSLPVYATFMLDHGPAASPDVVRASTSAAEMVVGQPIVAGVIGPVVTTPSSAPASVNVSSGSSATRASHVKRGTPVASVTPKAPAGPLSLAGKASRRSRHTS